ncbi:HPP family protein [Vibrio profundum]|uniref:HPP family protein n=1 Tax=Vibrio profundum TaxID=2910247 RepID=UPI003D0E4FCB
MDSRKTLSVVIAIIAIILVSFATLPFTALENALIGCFGASAMIVSSTPQSYYSRNWNIAVGMTISALIGVTAGVFIPSLLWAAILACSLSIIAMTLLKAEHPPAGALAILAVLEKDYFFLLAPVLTGTIIVLMMRYLSLHLHNKMQPIKQPKRSGEIKAVFTLLEGVSDIVNQGGSLKNTTEKIIESLCTHAGWPIGHAYLIGENNVATSLKTWYLSPQVRAQDVKDLIKQSESVSFEVGQGLIGKVMQDKELIFIPDVANNPSFLRAESAKANKVKGFFAFPIVLDGKVKMIFEFFSPNTEPLDDTLSGILQFSAKQICITLNALAHNEKINDVVDTFKDSVQQVVINNNESIGCLVESVDLSSGSIEEIKTSLSEMGAVTSEIAQKIQDNFTLTEKCHRRMGQASNEVATLSEASENVKSAISNIQFIADQTKLLSLNASIEAARAKESGKGFSIVAGEVKELAHKADIISLEIKNMASEMSESTLLVKKILSELEALIQEISSSSSTISNNVDLNNREEDNNIFSHLNKIEQSISTSTKSIYEVKNETQQLTSRSEELSAGVADFLSAISSKDKPYP